MMMYEQHSGEKSLTTYWQRRIDGEMTSDQLQAAADMAAAMYGIKWKRDYAVLDLDYNPIENYKMEESGTDTNSSTRTPQLTETSTRTPNLERMSTRDITPNTTDTTTLTPETTETTERTLTPETTETTERAPDTSRTKKNTGTETNVHAVAAFDSGSAYRNQSQDKRDDNLTETETETGTETTTATRGGKEDETTSTTRSGTETTTHTQTGNTTDVDHETETGTDETVHEQSGHETTTGTSDHVFQRAGNIGVTTSQQMLESEHQINAWLFFEHVFQDLDALFTIPIYYQKGGYCCG